MKISNPTIPFRKDSRIFSDIWPAYQWRPQQEEMARGVTRTLREDNILLVEAGTGVGKTLAYLLPLCYYALENDVRVAVSTETRSLQKQILEKDIPTIEKILGRSIAAEVCMGASNYVCKRKLSRVVERGDFGPDMAEHLSDFIDWESATEAGSRQDYTGFVTNDFWNRVTRESDNCLGRRCPNYDESYYFVAREKWKRAKVLIVNHSLLSAHISMEGKLLPEFKHVVIDEAHRFPEIYLSSFQNNMSLGELYTLFKGLGAVATPFQDTLEAFHKEVRDSLDLFPGRSKRLKTGLNTVHGGELIKNIEGLVKDTEQKLEGLGKGNHKLFGDDEDEGEAELEGSALEDDDGVDSMDELKLKTTMRLERLRNVLHVLGEIVKGPGHEEVHWVSRREKDRNHYYEMTLSPVYTGDLMRVNFLDDFKSVIFTSATLSSSGKDPFAYFKRELGVFADPDLTLPEENFRRVEKDAFADSVRSTMNTLADEERALEESEKPPPLKPRRTRSGPSAANSEIGESDTEEESGSGDETEVDEEELEEEQFRPAHSRLMSLWLDSPFDYSRRSILYLPRSIPDPTKEEEQFHQAAARLIAYLLELTEGGAFILFTSQRSLKLVHELLEESEEMDKSVELFSQSRLGAPAALAGFMESKQGALLGLATFWQGIDIPGDKLRLVILVRLPFRVPDEPVLEARMDLARNKGGNPFFNLQLPQAIIALKQGFGRLIRTAADRGAVCIIDPRVTTRSYGRDIISALPPARRAMKFGELKRAYLELFEKV